MKQPLHKQFFGARPMYIVPVSVFVLCIATLFPLKAFAAPLTTQQIIDLHSAGIGDAVITQQVEANGITFDADAAALLVLKKAGLSDMVLSAVVRRAAGTSPSVAPATTLDPVSDLYKSRKYPEVADLVMGKVRANSASDRERAILVLALLKLDNLSEAKVQANLLATQSPSSSYAPRLAAVLIQADEMRRLQGPVDDAIKRLSAKDLQSVIETSSLTESEKRDMLVDAAVISADFESARQILGGASQVSYTERNKLKIRGQKLLKQEQDFILALNDVDKFIYAPAAVSACASNAPSGYRSGPTDIAGPGFTIQAYLDAVRKLSALAPLNGVVLDRVFHATLITSKYPDVEEIGDTILRAKGQLRVVGYASNRFVALVIDSNGSRLLIEPDNHTFALSNGYPASEDNAVLFNLLFVQITGLSQSAGGIRSLGTEYDVRLSKHASAISVQPAGNFPQYALMEFIHCSLGMKTQQRATRNLGEFIQHVARIDGKYVSLVEPKEDQKPGSTGFASVIAGVGIALGVSGSSEMLQNVQANQSAMIEQQSRRSDLYSAGRFTFSVAESPPVRELEGALSLTTDGQT
jgi:hypothetical protein